MGIYLCATSRDRLRYAADVIASDGAEDWARAGGPEAPAALAAWLRAHAVDDCRVEDCPALVFARAVTPWQETPLS